MTEKLSPVEAQAVPDLPIARVLPKPGTLEVSKALDAMLAEYDFPANTKNAARAGWEAANRWLVTRPTPAAADPWNVDDLMQLVFRYGAARLDVDRSNSASNQRACNDAIEAIRNYVRTACCSIPGSGSRQDSAECPA